MPPVRRWTAICALLGLALLGPVLTVGCTPTAKQAPPSPGPTSEPSRPFTVMTTDLFGTADPAATPESGSAIIALNVFQRLMTAEPGAAVLKPDAARDCIFDAATVYVCTLKKNLMFHNGDPLTSSDVKFSIQRALRLDVQGASTSLFSSLKRIETPDPETIRFILTREDTQFGWALATPNGSIVDEEVYDPDEVRSATKPIVGSGPFSVSRYAKNELQLARNPKYVGRNPPKLAGLVLKRVTDSAAIERAMQKGTVDAVWRGLDRTALARLHQQLEKSSDQTTTDGYASVVLPEARVHELQWNPSSRHRDDDDLRKVISLSLQQDRTLDSVVPNGVPGHVAAFKVGGSSAAKPSWNSRIQLTLGYDSSMPDGRDIANRVRSRLESSGGLSVRLRPGSGDTDLIMVDRKAWTATAIAWLRPYLDHPLPSRAKKIRQTEISFSATRDEKKAASLLAALQADAAADLVVLPMNQQDEDVFLGPGVRLTETSFGPDWQLGLWGLSSG